MGKRNLTIIISALLTIILLSACKKDELKPVELVSISIKAPSTKVNFFVGDQLDLSGLLIVMTMNDGTNTKVKFSDFDSENIVCKPENGTTLTEGTHIVVISHKESGISASQVVSVTKVIETSIVVATPPDKLDYFEGDTLELEGLTIALIMNNGEQKQIEFQDFLDNNISCTPENGTSLKMNLKSVTIKHNNPDLEVKQEISVKEVSPASIEITHLPLKSAYNTGEFLDLSGLIVTIKWNNGTQEDISLINFEDQGITCIPANGTVLNKELAEISISYADFNISFDITISEVEVVIDVDGNSYNTVKIGEQTWMARNLMTTKYNDGTNIPLMQSNSWVNATTPMYCWYNNDKESYGETYGAMYNWHAAVSKKICPVGWHVPSKDEWDTLNDALGGMNVAGGKMKLESSIWNSPNTGATNSSKFNAVPSGMRAGHNGGFYWLGESGQMWSTTEQSAVHSSSYAYSPQYNSSKNEDYVSSKSSGNAIRCVKD